MKTPGLVVILKVFGSILIVVALVYAAGFGLNQMWLADSDLETKYPSLVIKYTSASHVDAAVCGIALAVSLFSFAFASLLTCLWQIEYYLRPKADLPKAAA